MPRKKPKILFFEDDAESVHDFYLVLCEDYEVTLSAHRSVVEAPRDEPFDLLILDLMIQAIRLSTMDLRTYSPLRS